MDSFVPTKMYKSNPPAKYSYLSAEPDKKYKEFQGSSYASRIEGTSNEWYLNTNREVLFNYVFENNGWPYIVYGIYRYSNQPRLKIQFIHSMVTGTISLFQYMRDSQHALQIQDPYMPVMFGGNGSMGNIDYEKLGTGEYSHMKDGKLMYAVWCEMLDRCYNLNHPYYPYFGYYGANPRHVEWHTFRYFYKAFDVYYHDWDYYPNPNDPSMYTFPMHISAQNVYRMSHLRSPVEQYSPEYSYVLPFDKRPEMFNSATSKKRGPKRLMYRLAKKVIS